MGNASGVFVEKIKRKPEPNRDPNPGDHYLSPVYGVVAEVVEVDFGEVVWKTRGGVKYRSDLARFRRTHRRIVRTRPKR